MSGAPSSARSGGVQIVILPVSQRSAMACTFSRSTVLRFAAPSSDSQHRPRHEKKRRIAYFSARQASPPVVPARAPPPCCSPPHAARLYRDRQPRSRNSDEGSLPFRLRSVPSPTPLSIIRTELYAGHHLHYSRPHDDLQHLQLVVALLRGEPQLVIPIELALLAGFFIVRARLSTRPRTSGVNP